MSSAKGNHMFKLVHFNGPTWCKFCTKFIWGLGKQGYKCKTCKYTSHIKCLSLIPHNCESHEGKEKKDIRTGSQYTRMNDLVEAMKDPSKGLSIKDHTKTLKKYPRSFVGSEAVNWMLQNLPIRDREEATELGNKLLTGKYIVNLSDQNKPFKDSDNLYGFGETPNTDEVEASVSSLEATTEDFDKLQVIGRGGFGIVWKVQKKGTQKVFAMKEMNKNKISGQRQLQCLIAEKNIMLNDNPFLVHLHYSFQTEDKLFFVMDYISGGDLAYHLERKGRFSEKEVRFITAEIVLALEHLHACGIVYRDLKLENILLDRLGNICLTDFGLSKELNTLDETTNTVCGTPTYLAPEVLLGKPYNGSIDWWSLGVVLFELFTGMNPFDSQEFDAVLSNILHSHIVVPDYVPVSGKELIEALLQRNPEKRLCSGPTGSAEIQSHKFYQSMDWEKLKVKQIKSPYVPEGSENFDPSLEGVNAPEGKGGKNIEFPDLAFATKSVVS